MNVCFVLCNAFLLKIAISSHNSCDLMGMVKHSQISQNSKFTMSLQFGKKGVRDEVYFLHEYKHQWFL